MKCFRRLEPTFCNTLIRLLHARIHSGEPGVKQQKNEIGVNCNKEYEASHKKKNGDGWYWKRAIGMRTVAGDGGL